MLLLLALQLCLASSCRLMRCAVQQKCQLLFSVGFAGVEDRQLDEHQIAEWQDKALRGHGPEMSGMVRVWVSCYFRSSFSSCSSPFALCGSLIRQWAGLWPCLKGRSLGLLAEHLLKDHSSGYIWGGLLLIPVSAAFTSIGPPAHPPLALSYCWCLSVFFTLQPLPHCKRSPFLPCCHPLALSVCMPLAAPSHFTHPSPCLNINRLRSVTLEGHWFCFVVLRNPLERQ